MKGEGGLVLGIDASRNRSGGAVTHLVGLLSCIDLARHGLKEVHVWTHPELAKKLPDADWLKVHSPDALTSGIVSQLKWQYFQQEGEMAAAGVDICLNTDAGSVCRFSPAVTMSRNMLPFDFVEILRHGVSTKSLRLLLLRLVHSRSIKHSSGTIFLSDYAARVISKAVRTPHLVCVVPHGIDKMFIENSRPQSSRNDRVLRCVYVSNTAPYKHQWNVVSAVEALRRDGYELDLELIGGGAGASMKRLQKVIEKTLRSGKFVRMTGFVKKDEILAKLNSSDVFLFASSCENFPNTLVEAMASGIPIACSARGPMPEILRNGGVFFEPTNIDSIAVAIKLLVDDASLAEKVSAAALNYSAEYSWKKCCDETMGFVNKVYFQTR